MIQAEGLEAVFGCLYPGAFTYSWTINGTSVSNYSSDIDSNPPSGGSQASLNIPARPEYNNTVVQCRAVVVVGGRPELVLSDNATLTVYGMFVDSVYTCSLFAHVSLLLMTVSFINFL